MRNGDRTGPKNRSPSSSTSSPPAGEDYRRLVERLPAIIYTSEMGEHGRWRYVSPQVEEILGYSPEDWIATPGFGRGCCTPRIASGRLNRRPKDARRPQPAARSITG